MGEFSLVHWLVVLLIVVLLFGAGRLPHVMGDFAKGIKAFKAGLRDDEKGGAAEAQSPPPSALASSPPSPAPDSSKRSEAETVAAGPSGRGADPVATRQGDDKH